MFELLARNQEREALYNIQVIGVLTLPSNQNRMTNGRIVYILGPIGVEQSQFTHKKLASFHKQNQQTFHLAQSLGFLIVPFISTHLPHPRTFR